MFLHNDVGFSFYLGDSKDNIGTSSPKEAYATFLKLLDLEALVLSKQTHGVNSRYIASIDEVALPLDLFQSEGDILVTKSKGVGVGVLTADCLPIIIHDQLREAIAVVHAGWRGTFSLVAPSAIRLMQRILESRIGDLKVYFGPSANSCCYEVGEDFWEQLKEKSPFAKQVIVKKQKYFFDLPLMNKLQLLEVGLKEFQVDECYNECTICKENYCSYRRGKDMVARQVSIAFLR